MATHKLKKRFDIFFLKCETWIIFFLVAVIRNPVHCSSVPPVASPSCQILKQSQEVIIAQIHLWISVFLHTAAGCWACSWLWVRCGAHIGHVPSFGLAQDFMVSTETSPSCKAHGVTASGFSFIIPKINICDIYCDNYWHCFVKRFLQMYAHVVITLTDHSYNSFNT